MFHYFETEKRRGNVETLVKSFSHFGRLELPGIFRLSRLGQQREKICDIKLTSMGNKPVYIYIYGYWNNDTSRIYLLTKAVIQC